jgi:hypothetical protein
VTNPERLHSLEHYVDGFRALGEPSVIIVSSYAAPEACHASAQVTEAEWKWQYGRTVPLSSSPQKILHALLNPAGKLVHGWGSTP